MQHVPGVSISEILSTNAVEKGTELLGSKELFLKYKTNHKMSRILPFTYAMHKTNLESVNRIMVIQ